MVILLLMVSDDVTEGDGDWLGEPEGVGEELREGVDEEVTHFEKDAVDEMRDDLETEEDLEPPPPLEVECEAVRDLSVVGVVVCVAVTDIDNDEHEEADGELETLSERVSSGDGVVEGDSVDGTVPDCVTEELVEVVDDTDAVEFNDTVASEDGVALCEPVCVTLDVSLNTLTRSRVTVGTRDVRAVTESELTAVDETDFEGDAVFDTDEDNESFSDTLDEDVAEGDSVVVVQSDAELEAEAEIVRDPRADKVMLELPEGDDKADIDLEIAADLVSDLVKPRELLMSDVAERETVTRADTDPLDVEDTVRVPIIEVETVTDGFGDTVIVPLCDTVREKRDVDVLELDDEVVLVPVPQ